MILTIRFNLMNGSQSFGCTTSKPICKWTSRIPSITFGHFNSGVLVAYICVKNTWVSFLFQGSMSSNTIL
jgi:hypothetical protein